VPGRPTLAEIISGLGGRGRQPRIAVPGGGPAAGVGRSGAGSQKPGNSACPCAVAVPGVRFQHAPSAAFQGKGPSRRGRGYHSGTTEARIELPVKAIPEKPRRSGTGCANPTGVSGTLRPTRIGCGREPALARLPSVPDPPRGAGPCAAGLPCPTRRLPGCRHPTQTRPRQPHLPPGPAPRREDQVRQPAQRLARLVGDLRQPDQAQGRPAAAQLPPGAGAGRARAGPQPLGHPRADGPGGRRRGARPRRPRRLDPGAGPAGEPA
jgi:hypothetical protein